MRDVASLAGVSISTVSRVVNGVGGVRADRVACVRHAVKQLGYRRDHTASTLRRADRTSGTIGLVFEDVSNPFFSAVHRGAEEVARRRGVLVFAGSSDEDAGRERELAAAFSSHGVDGLIIVPAGEDESYLLRDRRAGLALVFVDRPPRTLDVDAVVSDNAGGARAATASLLAAGHRRIGFLGDTARLHTASERLRGYRDALAAAGVAYDERLVRLDIHGSAPAAAATAELLALEDRPTALLAAQNLLGVGALHALRGGGLQHTIALIGFDDLPLGDVLEPGLSVVAQDPVALGRAAAELLFERLDGGTGPARLVVVPTRLIRRGSGELPPSAAGAAAARGDELAPSTAGAAAARGEALPSHLDTTTAPRGT
jgi:LacI family transcriptional regulator, galactose operon repressor